jgi:tight adherence protein C
MEYAIFAFLIAFLLVGSALTLLFYREALGQRLSGLLSPQSDAGLLDRFKTEASLASLGQLAGLLKNVVPKGEKETSVIRQRLILGGYRRETHINNFYAFKAVVPVMLCVIAAATGLYRWNPFIVFTLAIVVGYLIPDYWLGHRITAREHALRSGLPDLLDLMVVCLEAGLSMDQASMRASEELRFSHPVIADEITLVMLEVRAGKSRMEAWKHLASRTDVDSIRMLVSILVQADQFGTGVSKTLRINAETLRTRRKQRVEELAAKTTVKLVFPLVLFIFPSLFIIVIGPAGILLVDAFTKQ